VNPGPAPGLSSNNAFRVHNLQSRDTQPRLAATFHVEQCVWANCREPTPSCHPGSRRTSAGNRLRLATSLLRIRTSPLSPLCPCSAERASRQGFPTPTRAEPHHTFPCAAVGFTFRQTRRQGSWEAVVPRETTVCSGSRLHLEPSLCDLAPRIGEYPPRSNRRNRQTALSPLTDFDCFTWNIVRGPQNSFGQPTNCRHPGL